MTEAPIDSVADTQAEVKAETLPYAPADSVAEVKAKTL